MRKQLTLDEYVKTQTFAALMDNSGGLDSWRNYSGPRREDMIVVVTRTRDSETLCDSNFESALERLGGEGKGVEVVRDGHWGCGWLEHVMVNVKAKRKVKIALEINNELANYPVLDESDYSERQTERFREFAEGAKEELAEALALHFGVKNGRALRELASDLNMECQHYAGEDSCINIYTGRAPDAGDVKRVKDVLHQMEFQNGKSRTYKALVKAVNAYVVKAA